MSIAKLVTAIVEGNASEVNESLNAILGEKLQARLDARRSMVAEDVFDDTIYECVDLTTLTEDQIKAIQEDLDESKAGNLANLPHHLIKTATRNGGGQNSTVEKHEAGSYSVLKGHISDALSKGHMAVVHVNGKPVSAAHTNHDGSYGRETFQIHGTDKQHTDKVTKYNHRGGHSTERTKSDYTKSDAVNHIAHAAHQGDTSKEFFKKNKVEVHAVHQDKERAKKKVKEYADTLKGAAHGHSWKKDQLKSLRDRYKAKSSD